MFQKRAQTTGPKTLKFASLLGQWPSSYNVKRCPTAICFKIYYFSDGSSAQYKNFKNFANLRHHKKDFRVDAEWHFFATSHGKNACDCVGGMLKRLAAKASLQRHLQNQILTQISSFPLRRLWLALKASLYQKRRFRKYQSPLNHGFRNTLPSQVLD